jgi:hypothetical protein
MIVVKITNPGRVGEDYLSTCGFVSNPHMACHFIYPENAELIANRVRLNAHLDDEIVLVRV